MECGNLIKLEMHVNGVGGGGGSTRPLTCTPCPLLTQQRVRIRGALL